MVILYMYLCWNVAAWEDVLLCQSIRPWRLAAWVSTACPRHSPEAAGASATLRTLSWRLWRRKHLKVKGMFRLVPGLFLLESFFLKLSSSCTWKMKCYHHHYLTMKTNRKFINRKIGRLLITIVFCAVTAYKTVTLSWKNWHLWIL